MSLTWSREVVENSEQFVRFVAKRVQDYQLAEDLFHDSFVKALQSQSGPIDEEKVQAWFYRILRNVVTDHFRSTASNSKKLATLEREADVLLSSPKVRELCCDMEKFFLNKMNPKQAEIIRYLDLAEQSIADYAYRNGLSEGAVRVQKHRARKRLKDIISKVCQCLGRRTDDCGC